MQRSENGEACAFGSPWRSSFDSRYPVENWGQNRVFHRASPYLITVQVRTLSPCKSVPFTVQFRTV